MPRVAIIGAGPSGIFTAKQISTLAEEHLDPTEITIFDKNSWVGGMCKVSHHPEHHALITEMGAGAVAPNYKLVMEAMKKYDVSFEYMMPTNTRGIEFQTLFNNTPWRNTPAFLTKLANELIIFNRDYSAYRHAVEHKIDAPALLKGSFHDYCEAKEVELLPVLLKPFVTGFGYRDFRDCPTYSVLEYMGRSTLLDLLGSELFLKHQPLMTIHGGFQFLLERIAGDFNVKLGTHMQEIIRDNEGVHIRYVRDGATHIEHFDSLVLATSPATWPSLNMKLTPTEQACVENVKFNPYSIASVCIKGLTNEQYFLPQAMDKEHFGHVALLTSRDNRTDPKEGRFYTVYVNNHPGEVFDIQQNWESIVADLRAIGATDVSLVEAVTWPNYFSTLDWDLRLQLDREQSKKTMYTGSYTLGSFELVSSVANAAVNMVNRLWGGPRQLVENTSHFGTAWNFFRSKAYPTYDNYGFGERRSQGCSVS